MCENNVIQVSRDSRTGSSGRRTAVKMEDFERKLAETDAYLQLLIEQKTSLQNKVRLVGTDTGFLLIPYGRYGTYLPTY